MTTPFIILGTIIFFAIGLCAAYLNMQESIIDEPEED